MYSISRSASEHDEGSSMEHDRLTEALGDTSSGVERVRCSERGRVEEAWMGAAEAARAARGAAAALGAARV
jgi:hypothetical protein